VTNSEFISVIADIAKEAKLHIPRNSYWECNNFSTAVVMLAKELGLDAELLSVPMTFDQDIGEHTKGEMEKHTYFRLGNTYYDFTLSQFGRSKAFAIRSRPYPKTTTNPSKADYDGYHFWYKKIKSKIGKGTCQGETMFSQEAHHMINFFSQVKNKYSLVTADFKSVEKKFVDQGIDEPLVKDYFEKFKALRDKNKLSGNEKNIDLWAKKSFEEFKNKLDELSKEKTKTAKKKEARTEGAKLIAENEGWRVYEITSHKAAMLYGSDTKWCITQADGRQYNSHSDTNNIYYLLSKTLNTRENTWAKVALLVDTKGNKTYWDVLNEDHSAVPAELKIPKFKVEKAVHLVTIDGKKYDVLKLPENLKVSGFLHLEGTKITSLPAGLKVDGFLNLKGTPITSLPAGLKVGGSLYLGYTKITSLPAGLKVGGDLNLYGTPITSLPAGLTVGGYLHLVGTAITSLPAGLTVGGYLYLQDTKITSLPAGLKVGGSLYLSDTPITSLPAGLKVGGSLDLSYTKITSLPDDLKVEDRIFVDDPAKIQCSDEIRKKLTT